MGELTNRVKASRIETERVIQDMFDAAEIIDNTNISALHDALSETIKQRDELRVYNANQQSMLNKLDKELDVAREQNKQLAGQLAFLCGEHDKWVVKFQAAQRENEPLKIQVVNLQEFNDNQRKQLESLQKEMAAIHMCVVADSRTKLNDAAAQCGQMPFLLKAVYDAMMKSFDSKYAAERCASRIRAARHELES